MKGRGYQEKTNKQTNTPFLLCCYLAFTKYPSANNRPLSIMQEGKCREIPVDGIAAANGPNAAALCAWQECDARALH